MRSHSLPPSSHLFRAALIASALFTAGFTAGCSDDTPNNPPVVKPGPLAAAIEAVGGANALKQLSQMEVELTGRFIEPHQQGPEIDNHDSVAAEFHYLKQTNLDDAALRLEWGQTFKYPFGYEGNATFVLQGAHGSASGVHGFGSRYFGFDQPQSLDAARVAAIQKTQLMTNPLRLLQLATERVGRLEVSQGADLPPIIIELDAATSLPSRATTAESDALLGDVDFSVTFEDWRRSGALSFPKTLTLYLGDERIREEQVARADLAPQLQPAAFELEAPAPAKVDSEQARRGALRSQWYQRMFSFGFSQDFPLDEVVITELAPSLHLVGGGAALAYSSLVIEQSDGLIYIEPSLNHQRSQPVLKALNQKFNKPIKSVLATHTHMDHFGGVRTLLSGGGNLYLGSAGTSLAERVLAAPHSLFPDGLSATNPTIDIISVKTPTSLGSGDSEVLILPLATEHSQDMLVFYLPASQSLFVADLFNAGFSYGWDSYTKATQDEVLKRSLLLNKFIKTKTLTVTQLIGAHGGPAPIAELQTLIAHATP